MCEMIISPGVFSIFQNFDFLGFQGVKGQKMTRNDKKFCLLHLIFQESYIMWSSLMVQMCKRVIYPGIFLIFSKLWFFGIIREGGGRVKGQKMVQNDKIVSLTGHVHSCQLDLSPIVDFIWAEYGKDIFFFSENSKKIKITRQNYDFVNFYPVIVLNTMKIYDFKYASFS